MSLTKPHEFRPPRRHIRLRCQIQWTRHQLTGFSANISTGGLYLRMVPMGQVNPPGPGERLKIQFTFPDQAVSIEGTAKIAWQILDDHDVDGRAVWGFGLEWLELTEDGKSTLKEFIDTFRYTIVAVDDEPLNLNVLVRCLRNDYRLLTFTDVEQALKVFQTDEVAVLLTDYRMPKMNGVEVLKNLNQQFPNAFTKRIVISAFPEIEPLQDFVNVGKIFYFLQKPYRNEDLQQVLQRAVEAYTLSIENTRLHTELTRANERLRRENASLRKRLGGYEGLDSIIGSSPKLRAALGQLERVRRSLASVHIQGETGTGKELVARAIHEGSARADKPMVSQNCAGLTESLLQSTLFGHKKGSFTGADRDHKGVFQEADTGTLFLDEVAELSQNVQASLLRVLQEGEITPVGASKPTQVDVRVISATHKDLRDEVRLGHFREDLYFRLVVIHLRLPPLRERTGDIAILAKHFLEIFCERYNVDIPGFTVEAMQLLEQYSWPGNVRELENEIERVVVMATTQERLHVELLSPHISGYTNTTGQMNGGVKSTNGYVNDGGSYDDQVTLLEKHLIENALRLTNGVIKEAAMQLQMDPSRLAKLRKRLQISL